MRPDRRLAEVAARQPFGRVVRWRPVLGGIPGQRTFRSGADLPGGRRVWGKGCLLAQSGRPVLTVFVTDDHEVVRRGVADLLNDAAGMKVIGEASTVAQALARIPVVRPDVAVLDVRLPDGSGVELCRELRSRLPDLRCLMLTSYTDEKAMMDAFLAGADGFVIKDITGVDLVAAVRTVGSGRSLLDQRAAAALFGRLRAGGPAPGPLADLTAQEHTALDLIGQGLTNRQIAARMFVAEKTVKNYVSHLLGVQGQLPGIRR